MLVFQLVLLFMKQLNLEKYNDYELVYLAKEQHEIAYEILQKKYEPIIVNLAKKFSQVYKKIGLDICDYILEGKLALDKAINNFNDKYNNIFFTHAINYIKYSFYELVKNSKKDICLNNSISWSEQIDYLYKDGRIDSIESYELVKLIFAKLNNMEKQIVILKIQGYSYEDIANKLKIDRKKVDNILSKIRKNLRVVRKE